MKSTAKTKYLEDRKIIVSMDLSGTVFVKPV